MDEHELVLSGGKVLQAKEAKSESRKQNRKAEEEEEEESATESRDDELNNNNNGLMRWEKFLPKMTLSVLLVESDDSTRQLVGALLRKCSYRVASVSDGLKAWEILKRRPHSVDLILTEVDLPSISGYALLTLIMEHDFCKNIPVIMMSSQDSISMVYNCMLRGAADYLVKPLRKNELRNLWQHVWRRQASTTGISGPRDESVAQQKVEATAENNASGNHLNGDAACDQRNKEIIEKGSDSQSSCTKPELESESTLMDVEECIHTQLEHGESCPTKTKMQDGEECIHLNQELIMHGNNIGDSVRWRNADPEHCSVTGGEACDSHNLQITSSKEAIDLIGSFQNHPNSSNRNCTGKFDFSPQLDLSLRSYPCDFEHEATKERHTLMHSNASAFKRYTTNTIIQAPPADFINWCKQEREQRTICEKKTSNIVGHNSDSSTPSMQKSIVSPVTPQSKESELTTSPTQCRVSLPIPVKAMRYDGVSTAYGSVNPPPVFHTQSGSSSLPSPSSVPHDEPSFQVNAFDQSNTNENNTSEQLYGPCDQKGNKATNQIVYMQEHNLEHVEDTKHISPTTDQSACNNSNVDQVAIIKASAEGRNEEITNNGSSHRSIQREAALNKFRLKRKERCFEKKVRYESRKKLAEQRPRVKGQFVRQVHLDPQAVDKDGKENDH